MFYEKSGLSASVQRRREQIAPEEGAAVGFFAAGGRLLDPPGTRALFSALPAGFAAEAAFFAGGSCALYGGGAVYVRAAGEEAFSLSSVTFAGIPACARGYCGGEVLALSDGASSALLTAAGLASEAGIPPFATAAFFGDRLWTAQGMRLSYGAPDDAADFAQERGRGGYIDVPSAMGEIVALCAGKEELFVLRERGVQKLTGRGEERSFAVEDVLACPRIFGGSAAFDGKRLLWLAEDGPHAYGGEEIFGEAAALLSRAVQDAPRGACAGGRYALQANVCVENGTMPVLALFGEGGCCLLPLACTGLNASGGEVCFCTEGQPRALSGAPERGEMRKFWSSAAHAPYGGRCVLKEIRISARGALEVRAESDEGARTFRIAGQGRRQALRCALPGREFRFGLRTQSPAQVYGMEVLYERGSIK